MNLVDMVSVNSITFKGKELNPDQLTKGLEQLHEEDQKSNSTPIWMNIIINS